MNKYITKVLCIVLTITLGFSMISPSFKVYANEEISSEEVISLEGLFDGLEEASTAFAITEAYAMTATTQTRIVFDKIEEISRNVNLVQPLETHLNDINGAATTWLDEIKPQMLQVNQDIISWTNTQAAFAAPLRQAYENNDKDNFILGLSLLQAEAEGYQMVVGELEEQLNSYRDELADIVANLATDFNTIKNAVEGEDGQLAVLRSELDTLNLELESLNKQITGLAFGAGGAIVLGLIGAAVSTAFPLVGGVMMFTGFVAFWAQTGVLIALAEKREDILREIAAKTEDLNQTEFEYGVLAHIMDDTDILRSNTQLAFEATEGLKSQWVIMGTKIENLKNKLELDWENSFFLPYQIDILETEANQLNEFARGLQLEYDFTIEDLN
ncbi:HBL/NHE enterotoxin family protein [Chengkuizengella sediminis]|uniref:HBL/NHE enterotoxin family protein n=1 Tax=Chengkuizengella sediminis TaxID=1885917 RepID=UPI001389A924|nr:HBL/NHE enterotoxin family protein [Chengkuizengella sediminis]NDI33920.1 alpha-helical pore-forming toxin family protein [Chengkuizengella sediminis]